MAKDFDRLRLLWPDHLGLARGKYLTPEKADSGTAHCITLFTLGYDRVMIPHEGGLYYQGLPDCDATFDPDSIRPGWQERTSVVVPDITRGGHPVPLSPRNLLKDVVGRWADHGLTPMVGIELEAYLFEPDGNGGWRPISTPGAYVYGTGPAVDPSGTIDEIMATAVRAGIPMESVNSEYDNGQFELTLRYDDALTAADDAFLFKVMAREVAASRGMLLTFMGKPINDRGGSGLHVNLSFNDESGRNVLADEDSDDGLSEISRSLKGLAVPFTMHMEAFAAAEAAAGVSVKTRPPDFGIAGPVQRFAEGADFDDLLGRTSLAAGDLVRILRMTIQMLRQAAHALPEDDPCVAHLVEARARIDRDVVDARRQLELG